MSAVEPAEKLHRLVKHALDSGAAASIEEAESIFRGYRLTLSLASADACDALAQGALLTAIALGRRVFLGGVTVDGPLDVVLTVPLPFGRTLRDAVVALGGATDTPIDGTPTIAIGGAPRPRTSAFAARAVWAGWRGGVVPIDSDLSPDPGPVMPLAAMLSVGIAVNEAFLFVSGGVTAAGRRSVGLSLWRPSVETSWLDSDTGEPSLTYLPSRLWLIGLGHLGQAYLWGLGLLPYTDPGELSIVLQDVDVITASTESTSILSDATMVGQQKTRAMANWAERRGFRTAITERLFDAQLRPHPDEPSIALCGLDNALGRRALDAVGFDLVVEVGLGRGHRDFRRMRLHVLPGTRPAAEMWKGSPTSEPVDDRVAYRNMLARGELDRCGITLLAGKAVGAPFVGTVAATLALSEILRMLHGGTVHQVIDLDLESVPQRVAVVHRRGFGELNPGYAAAGPAGAPR